MSELLATFIFFFAVIDPIGTVPVFIAVTAHFDEAGKRRIAVLATFFSALILLFFVIAGEIILNAINIPLSAFQIAGGIVLFLFALTMIFGEGKPAEEKRYIRDGRETAIFPLAVPSIASPGAMLGAVLMTENNRFSLLEQSQTTMMILAVLGIVLVLLLAASFVHRLIGDSGASIISRVMGLILASVAVNNILAGIKSYFAL
ncbi:MAG: MarC family protein [Pseudomonadota bacterium]|nr:MarC family protein [Pseudomonadota bacterium]